MTPLPPRDPGLPGMAEALDVEKTRDHMRTALPDCRDGRVELVSATPVYVRYKPGTSCLIGHRLTIQDSRTGVTEHVAAQLRLYADDHPSRMWAGKSLHRLVGRAARRHPGSLTGRAASVPALNAILQIYPVDHALPQLVRASQRSKAGRLLAAVARPDLPRLRVSEIELVRYRPGRKALFRYRLSMEAQQPWGPEVYAKAFADDRATRLDRMTALMRARGVPLAVPLGASDRHRMGFHAAAGGVPLLALRGENRYSSALNGTVDALARLHAVPPDALANNLPAAHAEFGVGLLRGAAAALATLVPSLATEARHLASQLVRELESAPPPRTSPIHGDFYDDQVLVDGNNFTILDLDEARLGDPLTDAGNFLGHVSAKLTDPEDVAAARNAFLAAWAAGPGNGDHRAPLLHEAVALVLMAVGPFRRLEPDWPSGVAIHLELAGVRLREYQRDGVVRSACGNTTESHDVMLDRGSMARTLSRLSLRAPVRIVGAEMVRDKPGRRTTVRYALELGPHRDPRTAYAKRFASARAPHVHAALQELASALDGSRVPRLPEPLGCLPGEHLVLIGTVPGSPVIERLRGGDVGLAKSIADALYSLHASGAQLPRAHRPADELSTLSARVARLSLGAPALAAAARDAHDAILACAAQDWTWRQRPLHRDFYPEQVLVDGDRIGFVDLDDAAMGEPAIDVANFAAHLRLIAIRDDGSDALARAESAFIERYSTVDRELNPMLVRLLIGATCLRLAEIHVGRSRGAWLAHQLIEESRRCLPHTPATRPA